MNVPVEIEEDTIVPPTKNIKKLKNTVTTLRTSQRKKNCFIVCLYFFKVFYLLLFDF